MAGLPRPAPGKRASMRPPPRPNAPSTTSITGRSQSPAGSVTSSTTSTSRPRSPSVGPSAGMKRKERDFDHEDGEETNIHVVVRCRGRSDREVRENSGVVVSTTGVKGKNVELLMGPSALSNKTYHFDKVFSPAADQAMIFDDVVTPILSETLSGYNCTIFAYGQTGTGKTYTMSGDMTDTLGLLSDAAGIIPRTLYSLFQKLETEEVECSVKCSFIELYNEELRDLLSIDDAVKLKIYEDNNKKGNHATMVQGMEETHIKSANAGIKLLQQGSHRRQVAATKCNDLSSRSHTVFTITTYMKKSADTGEDFICAGKLNLVDLAGSENIQRSGAENKRAAEAGLINKSLLTLGRVINALVDKSSHIPYRESKLTRLLQDSLGGRTKTCLIATLSPAKSNLEETISTLDYAFRAKNIRNKPQVNSMISKKTLLREFTAEIEKLKSELIATRQRNGVYLSNEQYEEITVESESRRILSDEQKARIETMEISLRNKVQELFSLTGNFNSLKKDNEATRLTLDNTQDILQQTEIVLRETKQFLEEETKLRKAHGKTEAELHTIGQDLISTVGRSVGDVHGLHSKLRRRSDLHALNKGNWDSSTSKVINVSKLVDSTVASFQLEQSQRLAALSSRVDAFVSSEVQNADGGHKLLGSGLAKFEQTHKEVSQQALRSRDEMNEVLEEIKILRDDVRSRVGEGLNGLSAAAARISGEVIAELEQFHTQLHTSYSSMGKEFRSMFETLVLHINAQKGEAAELRQQLQVANQKALEASREAAAQLEAQLGKEQEAAQDERRTLLSKVQALIEENAMTQEARWSCAVKDTTANLNESRVSFEQADREYGQDMDEWMKKEEQLVEDVTKSRDNMKIKMKKDWISVNEHNTSIQKSTKAVHEETVRIVDAQLKDMAIQMAALDEFVKRARSQNGNQHDLRTKGLEDLSGSVHKTHEDIVGHINSASNRLNDFDTTSHEDLSALRTSLPPFVTVIHDQLSNLQTEIQSAPMMEYMQTGSTPQKREWVYATTLPRTVPFPEQEPSKLREITNPSTASPSKSRLRPASPTKSASPTKTKIFADSQQEAGNTSVSNSGITSLPPSSVSHTSISKVNINDLRSITPGGGLREMDINTIVGPGGRPQSADDINININTNTNTTNGQQFGASDSKFSKSFSGGMPPGLRRAGTDSKLPMKMRGGEKIGKVVVEGRENVATTGVVGGRRLRSSPQQ